MTYTTLDNIRFRDSKLFDQTLLQENMELYFDMGGREYPENRREWCAYSTGLAEFNSSVQTSIGVQVSRRS